MSRTVVLACALGVLAGLLLGVKVAGMLRALQERRRGRAMRVQGAQGERDAERVLRAHGYRIRERQALRSYAIEVEGVPTTIELCMDFVVERDGQELIAEVKTGHSAPRVQRAETRRQLLEYQVATGTPYVLLVDPDAERITEVVFPVHAPLAHVAQPSSWRAARGIIAALVLAAAAAYGLR
jgi:hypothetical protein